MRKIKSLISVVLVITMFSMLAVGCRKDDTTGGKNSDVKEFTAFFAVPGTELPSDNRVMNAIAEVTGAKVNMSWLTGQSASERIGIMISGGVYPDFIDGSTGTPQLVEAGAFIKIDQYWDNYPNIKNYLSESDWNKVRKEDGHIYYIPQFGILNGESTATVHWDEAFWIQKDVLEWANYPTVKTLDEYFDLIYRYVDAHPEINGNPTIGFEILSDDWRYFCLENPPMFLAGYPNDGAAIVDPETLTAYNYNTIPEAREYFKKINQVYNDGYIQSETFTNSYDQYISRLSSGRVVGMVDQAWNFNTAVESLVSQGLHERTYVPLPITLDRNTVDRWYNPAVLDVSNGVGISVSCKDIEGAMQFLNDLLSPEVMVLRFWGEKDVDYKVGDDGIFYRTPEQIANSQNQDWATRNLCQYSYFPQLGGMLADGINVVDPRDQPREYYETLSDVDKRILDGYGYNNFLDFLTKHDKNSDWFPLWSYTNTWTNETAHGVARAKMDEVKREYLPKVIMAPVASFDAVWEEYQTKLTTEVDIQAYEDAITAEVRRRVNIAQGK